MGGLPRGLWSEPDVRWLTGAHDAGTHTYLVREPYEELLWWLQMPSLLRIAGQPSPKKANMQAISQPVRESLAEAGHAGYRLDEMLQEAAPTEEPVIADATHERSEETEDLPTSSDI